MSVTQTVNAQHKPLTTGRCCHIPPNRVTFGPMPSHSKTYPRATLKKILKGHSNKKVGKGVDQLVRFHSDAQNLPFIGGNRMLICQGLSQLRSLCPGVSCSCSLERSSVFDPTDLPPQASWLTLPAKRALPERKGLQLEISGRSQWYRA